MKVQRFTEARSFLDRTQKWLRESDTEHNSILGDAYLLLTGEHPFRPPIYLSSIEQGGRIVGCAVRPPPDGLTLTRAPSEAIELLAGDVASVFDALPGLSGPEGEATQFARLWSDRHGCAWSVDFEWRWYQLDRVAPLSRRPAGRLRLADNGDRALLQTWADAYAKAVRTSVDVRAFFERRIDTQSIYLWEDRGPRTLVAVSGLTPTNARISAVYTPPESRGNGYATTAVAEVSGIVLEGRPACVLFADRTDPTPNKIYMRIGYRPVCDTVGITFAVPSETAKAR